MKNIRIKNLSSVLYSAALLAAVVIFAYYFSSGAKSRETVSTVDSESYTESSDSLNSGAVSELRAVWIPYMSLDISTTEHTEADFKEHFDKIISRCKSYGINAVIVQVRPFCDALYKSDYFPLSHIITGTQGDTIDYDPLKYMVEACHKENIEFHAWINPYRIKVSNSPEKLSEKNPYYTLKKAADNIEPITAWNEDIYLNPASAAARELIINGVREIVENYEVDAVQFDDYFYPTESTNFDIDDYKSYVSSLSQDAVPLTQLEWRKSNVNSLVAGVYSAVHSIKSNISFGISPQGNIDNDLNMGADVAKWCSYSGYVDYICPQIYYNFENEALPFDKAVTNWKKLTEKGDVKLYAGLAVYKAGSDADSGSWEKSNDILKTQIEYLRSNGINGFMLYSYDYLQSEQTETEMQNVMKVM